MVIIPLALYPRRKTAVPLGDLDFNTYMFVIGLYLYMYRNYRQATFHFFEVRKTTTNNNKTPFKGI